MPFVPEKARVPGRVCVCGWLVGRDGGGHFDPSGCCCLPRVLQLLGLEAVAQRS